MGAAQPGHKYTVQYKLDTAASWTTACSNVITSTCNIGPISTQGIYYWKVLVTTDPYCGNNEVSDNPAKQFEVTIPCDPVTAINNPTISNTCEEKNFTLSWNTIQYADSVEVQFSTAGTTDSDFSISSGSLAGTATTHTTSFSNASMSWGGTEYSRVCHWRIRASNACTTNFTVDGILQYIESQQEALQFLLILQIIQMNLMEHIYL